VSNDSCMQKFNISKEKLVHNADLLEMRKKGNLLEFNESQFGPEKEIDFKEEFYIILESMLNPGRPQEIHFVHRCRMMKSDDSENFFTIASQAVVACSKKFLNKHDKHHKMYLHLNKARGVVDKNSIEEMLALEKIEELVEKNVNIF